MMGEYCLKAMKTLFSPVILKQLSNNWKKRNVANNTENLREHIF